MNTQAVDDIRTFAQANLLPLSLASRNWRTPTPRFKRRRGKREWLQDIAAGWLQVREAGTCQTLGDARDMTRA